MPTGTDYDYDYAEADVIPSDQGAITLSSGSSSLSPWMKTVVHYVRRNPKNVGLGIGTLIVLGFYVAQMQAPAPPELMQEASVEGETTKLEDLEGIDLSEEGKTAIAQAQADLYQHLNNDRQLSVISQANHYIGKATAYTTQKGHKCEGMTVVNCLQTFEGNRINELASLPENPSAEKVAAAQFRVQSLALAQALATLPSSRSAPQQALIDGTFPLAMSGVSPQMLQPNQFATALRLQRLGDSREQAQKASEVEQNALEICLSLSQEVQAETGGCF